MSNHLTLIVATDRQGGIGIQNALPWKLPEDMAFFKRTTSGHPVIMGRKTFDSIGRPLPNRRNIVVSRNPDWAHAGVELALTLEQALALVGDAQTFVIGGAQIYAAALAHAGHVLVTEIDHDFACDAFFPRLDPQQWQEISREAYHSDANAFDYAFVHYQRRTA